MFNAANNLQYIMIHNTHTRSLRTYNFSSKDTVLFFLAFKPTRVSTSFYINPLPKLIFPHLFSFCLPLNPEQKY